MSPLPRAVIGIICYLWSHNKVCHGAFSVIIFLFVSSRAADGGAEPGQAAGARRGRGRAAPMAALAGDVTPSQWGGRQPAPPGAAAFPTDTGNGLFPGKPSEREPGTPPRGRSHTDPRREHSRAPKQQRGAECPAFKRGCWFGAPSAGSGKPRM